MKYTLKELDELIEFISMNCQSTESEVDLNRLVNLRQVLVMPEVIFNTFNDKNPRYIKAKLDI